MSSNQALLIMLIPQKLLSLETDQSPLIYLYLSISEMPPIFVRSLKEPVDGHQRHLRPKAEAVSPDVLIFRSYARDAYECCGASVSCGFIRMRWGQMRAEFLPDIAHPL